MTTVNEQLQASKVSNNELLQFLNNLGYNIIRENPRPGPIGRHKGTPYTLPKEIVYRQKGFWKVRLGQLVVFQDNWEFRAFSGKKDEVKKLCEDIASRFDVSVSIKSS